MRKSSIKKAAAGDPQRPFYATLLGVISNEHTTKIWLTL